MAKIKSIKAEDVEKLIKNVQQLNDYTHTAEHPSMVVGYARQWSKTFIQQLKGEFPIL